MTEPRRSIAGRRNRSLNGLCSSTASRVSCFSPTPPLPYTERRRWTISAVLPDGVRARPMKIISTPSPTTTARRRVVLISSYLDRDHATNDEVADEDHEGADGEQNPADDALEHRSEVGWSDEVHEGGEHDGKECDQGSGCSCLGRQCRD